MKRKYGELSTTIKNMKVNDPLSVHITEHSTTRSTLDRIKRHPDYYNREYTLLKSGKLTYTLTRTK